MAEQTTREEAVREELVDEAAYGRDMLHKMLLGAVTPQNVAEYQKQFAGYQRVDFVELCVGDSHITVERLRLLRKRVVDKEQREKRAVTPAGPTGETQQMHTGDFGVNGAASGVAGHSHTPEDNAASTLPDGTGAGGELPVLPPAPAAPAEPQAPTASGSPPPPPEPVPVPPAQTAPPSSPPPEPLAVPTAAGGGDGGKTPERSKLGKQVAELTEANADLQEKFAKLSGNLDAAVKKAAEALLAEHQEAYEALASRMILEVEVAAGTLVGQAAGDLNNSLLDELKRRTDELVSRRAFQELSEDVAAGKSGAGEVLERFNLLADAAVAQSEVLAGIKEDIGKLTGTVGNAVARLAAVETGVEEARQNSRRTLGDTARLEEVQRRQDDALLAQRRDLAELSASRANAEAIHRQMAQNMGMQVEYCSALQARMANITARFEPLEARLVDVPNVHALYEENLSLLAWLEVVLGKLEHLAQIVGDTSMVNELRALRKGVPPNEG